MGLLLQILLGTIALVTGSNIYIVSKFEINSTEGAFNHMALNKNTGNIYIGAMNNLYQLSSNLTLIKSATTGPKYDNPNCPTQYINASCDQPQKPMNSYNKALVIDYNNSKLISCSSLYHGICERYCLRDLESKNQDSYVPVVGNNPASTTVAFIAPGPPNGVFQSDVLYVAASRTNAVPAVASRRVETFDLFYKGIGTSSSKNIEAILRDAFPVYYIYGFSSDKFSYFVTVQKRNPKTESYISKLIRVCQADINYYSYAEVQLKCMHNDALYNLVQAAYVAKAGSNLATTMGISRFEDVLYVVSSIGNPNTTIPGSDSALCVYPLRQIRRIFTENIKACFDGTGNTGPSHIISQVTCLKTKFNISDDYCGTYDINTPIDGQSPIQTEAAITFKSEVSAVAVTTEFQDTIAFVGTANGHIIKVLIKSGQMASSYEEITLEEGSKVYADIIFDLERHHLYTLMDRKIYKIKVQECSQHTACKSCLGANDPYCGWCSFEIKCSQREECNGHEQDLRWLTSSTHSCTTITHVVPDKILKEHQNITQLLLNISNLPIYEGKYECVFSSRTESIQTPASRNDTGSITCDTPTPKQLPPIPSGQDHIVMQLSVRAGGIELSSTNFTVFDCNIHTSCKSCTLSDFSCTWCINNHMCTFETSGCPNNRLVLGKNVKPSAVSSHNEGPGLCPQIQSSEIDIFVPSETDKKILVSALNLEDFQTSLVCVFNLNNGTQVNATVTKLPNGESIVECELVHFFYSGDASDMRVPFQISWAPNKSLDNPENIQVIMYKCDKMVDSCGGCLNLKNQYKCGWCDRYCTINSRCASMWLPTAATCPDPEITEIEPTSGPKVGGTYLTITGKNLGKSFSDISGGIYIENGGKVNCAPVKELYIAPVQIVCLTGASSVTGTGQLVVTINNQYNATSNNTVFSYVNPVLVQITPSRGPKSGGTLITLSGYDMNAGTKRTVWIGKHKCEVKSFNSTIITCVTSMAPYVLVENLSVQFDKHIVTSNIHYQYITDPTITNIDPKVAIVSGGIRIDVTGTQLHIIQKPKMIIWDGDKKCEGDCKVESAIMMHCYSPQVKARISNNNTNSTKEEFYSYGFILDNTPDVLNLTEKDIDKFGIFKIVPDPVFELFPNTLEKTYQSKTDSYIIINAMFLSGVAERDVVVGIGDGFCNEIYLAKLQVICKPPKNQPKSLQGSANPEVIVYVGHNFSKLVGYLHYDQQVLPLPIIIGVPVGVVVLIIVSFVVILIIKIRENKSMKKKWQTEMHNLESKIAKEEDNTDTSRTSLPVIDKSTLAVLNAARLIITSNRLRFEDIIGKGHFGCVFKGYLTLPGAKVNNLVAIKTLHKKNLRDIDVDAFLREVMIMKEFNHPHVLRLLGICLGPNDMPLMVLPFMEHGDLLCYIRDDTNIPTVKDLIHFGLGIAEGMTYLSDHKFVHRDLAARNCMLDEDLRVKVADFGLSREIYEREYYTSDNKKTKLPIRWMAPESIEKGTYSSKSDVWSYGIVLWELMTMGVTPYPEVDNWDILMYLKKGKRLLQPQYCPDQLYEIMRKCWLVDPHDRPIFSVLARDLTDMVSVIEHDMQQGLQRIDIHCTQVNQADAASYHYAYDDSYLEPHTKTEPIGGVTSRNGYIEVFDDTSDVKIYPNGCDNGINKIQPFHYAYDESYLEPPRKTEPKCDTKRGNDYMEVLDDTSDVQIYATGGANGNNKNAPFRYAYDEIHLEPPTQPEPIGGTNSGNDYMEVLDDIKDVQFHLTGGANGNSKNEHCHYAYDECHMEQPKHNEEVYGAK